MGNTIRHALAAGKQRATKDRADADQYEVFAGATSDPREARRLREEAAEARERADTLDAMFMRHW
jgi:putative ubiquitin-RnfH superfamily antitoxin RatB of RatAB toxin-antitoxin module